MDFRIIFPNGNGGVAIVVPAPNATIEQCLSAVPEGVPYKIVDASEIPEDRAFRNAWEYQE